MVFRYISVWYRRASDKRKYKQSVSRVEVVNYHSDLDILQCDELAKMILLYSLW